MSLKNKRILILGGTGALGKTLIKRFHDTNEIFVFSRDEHKQFELMKKYPSQIKFEIGDIRNRESLISAINKYKPDIIINVAAQKHIHICEWNPYESIQTNVIGNQNLLEAIQLAKHQIEGIIFTSTDKACKPINVYGMCKSISERLYQNFAEHNNDFKITIVRYGNVLESTGSIIPIFKKMLGADCSENLRPVNVELPITHPEMTRFFLTLEKAIKLLIDWAWNNPESHGCVVVPKTPSLRIVDLADVLIEAYNSKASTKIIGIRPGEKLHEELISYEESMRTRVFSDYFLITNKIQTGETPWSYTSDKSLITDKKEIVNFLGESNVL